MPSQPSSKLPQEKKRNIGEPRVPKIHDSSTLEPWHLTCLYKHVYIILTMCSLEEKGRHHKNSNHISSDEYKYCTTHKFHHVSHGKYDQER